MMMMEETVEETTSDLGFHTIMDIPIHILFDIFLKLPAVSLVRCYSVCSKFKSIVSDSSFQQSYFSKAPISFVFLSNHNHLTCIDYSQTLNPINSSDHGSSSCMAMQLPPSKRIKTITTNTSILHHHHHQSSRAFSWHSYNKEPASSNECDSIIAYALWEQINVTRDSTDSLWYMTDVNIDINEGYLKNGQSPLLTIMSAGHAMHVFISGQLSGSVYGSLEFPKLTSSQNVKLRVGNNKISLLGITDGLPNVGVHFETWNAGVLGLVTLKGLNEGMRDLSRQKWSYKATIKETKTRNKQKRRELLSHLQEIGDEASGGGLLSRILINV